MQINNKGDWAPEKSYLGLTKGTTPGQQLGIETGVQWLTQKAYIHDAKGNATFIGWDRGVTRYNGNGDPNYLSKVQTQQNNISHPMRYK